MILILSLLVSFVLPFVSSLLATDPNAQTRQAILGRYGAAPYTALAAGNGFSCAVLLNGNVACWGRNDHGRLARQNTDSVGASTTVATKDTHLKFDGTGVRADAVFAGDCYAGAIVKTLAQPTGPSEPGDLLMWGCCTNGVCGSGVNQNLGDTTDRPVYPTGLIRMPQNRKVLAVGAGPFHLCAILNATETVPRQDVVCWGRNTFGSLGRGDTKDIGDAQSVEIAGKIVDLNNRNIIDVCAGWGHSCALDDKGIMSCWGLNTAGQLGIGSTDYVGRNSSNVNEYMPSNPLTYIDVGKDLYVTQIACGNYHTCALLSDSTVRCWGNSTYGQTGLGRKDMVAANRTTLPSLTGPIYLPPGSKAIAVFAGGDSSAAVLDLPFTNHRLLVWGANHRGQLGLGHTNHIGDDENPGDGGGAIPWYGNVDGRMPYYAAIGSQHICVILIWGQVTCHGANSNGELGNGNTVDIGDNERVSAGGIVALPTWMVQNYTSNGILPDQVSAGDSFICGILDGRRRVYCTGINNGGSLGLGFKNTTGTPAQQVIVQPGLYSGTSTPPYLNFGGLRIMRIAVGAHNGCAIREDNKIFCWGWNAGGVLGCGRSHETMIGDDESPLDCSPNIGVGRLPLQLSCSHNWNCLALLEDGYVMGWGNNDNNIMGWESGTTSTPVVINKDRGKFLQISNGGDCTCFAREVGGIYCSGGNHDGRWGRDPYIWVDNVGFVRQISTSYRSTNIITNDRKLAVSGAANYPFAGSLGLGNTNNVGIDSMINALINTGGTGIVLSMAKTVHGNCYVTSDYDVRCYGYPTVNGQGSSTIIGDNESPGSQPPLTFPNGFGRVIPTLSNTYSNIPNHNLCMIGTNGQPACWGGGGSWHFGLTVDVNCGDSKPMSTCSLVNVGIGNSVGYYPPTMIAIRPLPFPGDIPNGDPKGTVFECDAKYIGSSRIEPDPLTVWFGDTTIGCNSLSRLSPSKLLCTLTESALQDIRQANAATPTPNSFYTTVTWGSATVAQPVTNLGVLTTFTEPTVIDVTPNLISTTLPQRITITGTGFGRSPDDKPRAWVGKYECTNPLWISDTSLSCLSPLAVGANLTITVTVQGNVYPSRSIKKLISYIKPNITSITPTVIAAAGGQIIHIRGYGYGNDVHVAQLFGNYSVWLDNTVPCLAVTYVSDTYMHCTVPNGYAKRNISVTVIIGGQNTSSTDSGIYISVEYPVLATLIPSFVYTGDNQDTHDFNITGSNFNGKGNLYVYGNPCTTFVIVNASFATCYGLSVYNFTTNEGIYMVTDQGIRSDVYTKFLTVLPRARVVSVTPPAARVNTVVLIEGSTLGYVPWINISTVLLGSTPCVPWRYSTPGVSILCTVGNGRGNNVPIRVRFTDGPEAYVVPGVTFSYVNDLRLIVNWSSSTLQATYDELSFLPLPSLPSNPLFLTPAPTVLLTDDQGLPLPLNIAQSVYCTLFIDESKSLTETQLYVNGNTNSVNLRLFGNTTINGNVYSGQSMVVFDTVGVTGTFGYPFLLQVTCGIPVTGPFFTTSTYLNTSIARLVPYFSALPVTGEMVPSTGTENMKPVFPSPVLSFRVMNGQRRSTVSMNSNQPFVPLALPRTVLPFITCTIDALTPALASNYVTSTTFLTPSPYRLVGSNVQSFSPSTDSSTVVVNFTKLGLIAPFNAPIVWGATCAWLTQEPLRSIANTTVHMMNISVTFNLTNTNNNNNNNDHPYSIQNPRPVRYNADFSLPNIRVRITNSSVVPPFTGSDMDCTLSVKHTLTNTPVPFFGGLSLPYSPLNGTLLFQSIALQPLLQVSKTNTDPLSVSTDSSVTVPNPYTMAISPTCWILGQSVTVPPCYVSLQRLQLVWITPPPIAFMPSSCGRSTNSSVYLGGILDANTGTLSESGTAVVDTLAPIAPSLPTVTVGLQDYDTGTLANEETGGLCAMTIGNATYATKTPVDQRRAALGGTTVVYTTNGKAVFQGITINSPLGSSLTLQVECSRAQGGGRSLTLSTPIAMMDGVLNWLTVPSVTANVLTNNQAISIPAIPVAHNRSTTLKLSLKIRQPIDSPTWGRFSPVTVRDFQPGIDPPTVCTLVLSQNGIVTTTSNTKITVPLDTVTTKLYLRTAPSSTTTTTLADATGTTIVNGWTLNGNNGDVGLTFQLVAPLDTPVAVQSMCSIGASVIYSDPVAIVATAAKLAFENTLTSIPYAILPSLPDDPVKNSIRLPYIAFGLLTPDSSSFLTNPINSLDYVPIGCKLQVVDGSVTLSPSSLLELSSCDANVIIEGADVTMVDPVTGVATFTNVILYGPLGTRLTLRSSCMRPYIDTVPFDTISSSSSPVSRLDTSVIIADAEVVWHTAESVGMERTRLGASIVFQADTTLRIVVKLNWLLPVAGKASTFVRMEMNETTLTPSLSLSCSLRVPDRQVRTSSIYYETHDVPAFDDGTIAFLVRLVEPLAYPFTLYADCSLPTKQTRSTPPLMVTLVSPSPIPRRAAFTANPSLSSTSSALPTGTVSVSSGSGNSMVRPSETLSPSPTVTGTPSPTRTTSSGVAGSVTGTRTPTSTSTPTPSLKNEAQIQFDMVIPAVPLSDIDTLYTSIQVPDVLHEFSKGVLRMLQSFGKSTDGKNPGPTSTRITSVTNSHTGTTVYIPSRDSVYDASSLQQGQRRELQSSVSGSLTVGIIAAYQDTSVAQGIIAAVQTVFGSNPSSSFNVSSYLASSFALLQQVSGVPTSSILVSCCAVNTTSLNLTILSMSVASNGNTTTSTLAYFITYVENTSLLIVAAVLGSILVLVLTVWMYTTYRARQMHIEEYRNKRLAKSSYLPNASTNGKNGNGNRSTSIAGTSPMLAQRLLEDTSIDSTADNSHISNAKQWEYTAQVLEDMQRAIHQQDAAILALNNRLATQQILHEANVRTAWMVDSQNPSSSSSSSLPNTTNSNIGNVPFSPNRHGPSPTMTQPVPYYPGTIVEVIHGGNGNNNSTKQQQQDLANIDKILFNVPQY